MSPLSDRFARLAAVLCVSLALLPGTGRSQARRQLMRNAASGAASAPVPPDPRELAAGAVQAASTPNDRLAALSLLRAAAGSSLSHKPDMPPFSFQSAFNATGSLSYTGGGQLTEIWMSGQNWRVTESLGNYSLVRTGYSGRTSDGTPVSMIPMRAHMLRNEIMWAAAINNAGTQQIRTASAQWNGAPVTCILLSGVSGPAAAAPSRLWEENEYCVANDSRLLQIHSPAPGTYAVFGYAHNQQFHGKPAPDHITIFVNGQQVVDSTLAIADPTPSDQALLADGVQTGAAPSVVLGEARLVNMDVAGGASGDRIEPVVVHVQFDGQGAVLESEVSASSNPALTQRAVEIARGMHWGVGIPHAYVNVRFLPAGQ